MHVIIKHYMNALNSPTLSRRRFLLASVLAVPAYARSMYGYASEHPTPRPGIDASRVLTEQELGDDKDAIAAFNEVRQIPQIVDGIRCSCGCARAEGNYSLLSCFERPRAMARWCDRCQREARYVYSLQRNGKTLDEIREAIDSRYH
jgi:hypothetical protein